MYLCFAFALALLSSIDEGDLVALPSENDVASPQPFDLDDTIFGTEE